MKITAREKRLVEAGRAEVLETVEKFEDVTFGHLTMAEKILEAIGLDPAIVMEAAIAKKKSQKK